MQASTTAVSMVQATLEMDPHLIEPGSPAHRAFLKIFYLAAWHKRKANLAVVELPVDACGATEYYEKLVRHNFRLPFGTMVRAVTPGQNNRRMIIIVGQTGNIVIFERFSGGLNGVIVSNVPRAYLPFTGSGAMDEQTFNRVTGGGWMENVVVAIMTVTRVAATTNFSGDIITSETDKEEDDE